MQMDLISGTEASVSGTRQTPGISGLPGLACLLLAVFFLVASYSSASALEKRRFPPDLPFSSDYGGRFELLDQNNKRFTQDDLSGRYSILYFGFTDCPDTCPLALYHIATAWEQLETDGHDIQAVFVNLDSSRMSVSDMKEYLAFFHPRFIGLRGDDAQIRKAAGAYRIRYKPYRDEDGERYMVHSGMIFLIDPDGVVRAYFPHDADPEWIAATTTRVMTERGAK